MLETAWNRFRRVRRGDLLRSYEEFCCAQASWLEDYALFRALKIRYAGAPYMEWPAELVEHLDERRRPKFVAGVPPDYFSALGQLWGNPVYDWGALRSTGYRWWIERFRALLSHVDLVRLDHFPGFAAALHVPSGAATAQTGSWQPGPGNEFRKVEAIMRIRISHLGPSTDRLSWRNSAPSKEVAKRRGPEYQAAINGRSNWAPAISAGAQKNWQLPMMQPGARAEEPHKSLRVCVSALGRHHSR